MNMGTTWTDPADNECVLKFHSEIIKRVKAETKAKGLDNDFIYQNYASQFDDVFSSHGKVNQKKLVAISKKYDCASLPEAAARLLQIGR